MRGMNEKLKTETENKQQTPAFPRLAYTMEETAKMLGVSYVTIHRLIKRGHLRSSRVLRHKLIPAAEIQRFFKVTVQ